MAVIRLTQLDGKLPNLALMRLAAYHEALGDAVLFQASPVRGLFEPEYDRVYGSAIFSASAPLVATFEREFPGAVLGGTGTASAAVVEDIVGDFEGVSYAPWPAFRASLGFTQRGCRLKCAFCVVPAKEGRPRSVASIAEIWRGEPWPRHIHLLDNDFFGNPDWRERLAEVRAGRFKVCFNQGINLRLVTNEIARELARVDYRDDSFKVRRLYTAWDNLGDQRIFFRGVERLEAAGIPPTHLMAYMLIGYDPAETWADRFVRLDAMVARGIRPFPMVYGDRPDLRRFARWVIRRQHFHIPWAEYSPRNPRAPDPAPGLFEVAS
jgi:hypothetical protein